MKLATTGSTALHGRVLCQSIALALTAMPAFAQEVDHAAMGHAPPPTEEVDHAAMGHHATPPNAEVMGHDMPEHHGHVMDTGLSADEPPINPIPPITRADREAAFPDVAGHHVHDNAVHSFWLLDRLEAWDADTGTGAGWEATAWVGTDIDRLWLRSEGEHADGTTGSADIEVLYGRAIAPWWDLVAGVRHDFGEGPSQTFAAIGVQGLSTYMFEIGATAYVGESGQTAASLEIEYETLFTNRLVLQSMAEAELHGKDDVRRGIGSGLGMVEVGLRLRYEVTRQFAPYIGVVHERAFGKTADLRRAAGEDVDDSRVVAGLRLWF
ncbi:copper resistance protein B [Lysobacter sp. F60174L2]|uniref:copper resistance protein B n=1 Tax=Lysobacter sp. F60174L2 TaxID=3459295 RepID=UPI00403E073E